MLVHLRLYHVYGGREDGEETRGQVEMREVGSNRRLREALTTTPPPPSRQLRHVSVLSPLESSFPPSLQSAIGFFLFSMLCTAFSIRSLDIVLSLHSIDRVYDTRTSACRSSDLRVGIGRVILEKKRESQ